jgi:C-terminal processing protease CtpA/Prc
VDTEFRGREVSSRWTYDAVPGERYLDRPLIILTNSHTFSAAESFTFGMKVTGRAQTIGEGTGGGGHFGSVERLTPDFTLFVPVGRTFDPRTGLGWEAEGIQPDVEARSDEALAAAVEYLAGLSVE